MIETQIKDEGPWYKQFWAWFIFTPLIVVVIASMSMVVIAFKTKQDIVVDDYYKVGKMINQAFEPEKRARELGVKLNVTFDLISGEILIEGNVPSSSLFDDGSLLLNVSHPVDASKDRFITLLQQSNTRWRADLGSLSKGRWYLRLSSIDNAGHDVWRLKGEITLSDTSSVQLF